MKIDNPIFMDTNVVVYASQAQSPFQSSSRAILEQGLKGDLQICISPQVLAEFYSTVTNPKRVTDPISQALALAEMKKYVASNQILMIFSHEETMTRMLDLLERYPVKQQGIFDLQIVATMLSNGINRLCTYNREDFERFGEIEVFSP